MAGPQLNFGGTTVVNPYESLINVLGKNGALAQTMIAGDEAKRHDQDRLLRQQQLDMQKTEHQMKVDEQVRQLAEIDNTKKFYTGLEKPAELATASALFNQNNNPLLQKQIDDMQYKPTDTAEDTIRKTKLQDELGKFGTGMSAMPELQETRLQQGRRLLGEMGANAPLAGIKKLDEMHAAEVAASAAKSKEASDAIKHGQDNFIKLNIEAMKHGKGTTITADDGTILPIGGNGKVLNPLSFGVKQTEDKIKDYEAGTKALTSRMDALGAGKAEDIKTGQRVMAMDALNKYAGEGYDPADLASIITTKFQADPKFYEVWKDKQSGIVLTPEELKPLEAKRTASAALDNMKLQEAQYAMLQSQAKNSGTAGADILKTFAPYYQDQITKATGEKALLAMTPEQRQAQATTSYLGKLLTPTTETTDAIASRENATTFYKDGKVSYNKPKGYDDKPPTDNYGVKAITVKAVDEIKRLVDEKDRTSPYADLFAVSSLYESDGNSKATYKEKNGNTAEGLLQWSHPARKEALLKYVNGLTDTQYKSVSDVPANLQYKYFEHDITNGQYKHVGKALASAKTDAEKMQIITDMYEQPAYGAHQAKIRSEGMTSYISSTPKAIERADREQFNLLLNKENKTAEDTAKLDSLSKILNVGLPKDGEWKPTFEDYTAKERGNKVNIQQLFADASSAPDAPVLKAVPTKSAQQLKRENSWSGQLTNKLVGDGGHLTLNNLGKIASQVGDNLAVYGTAGVGGLNRTAEFFTQPVLDAYNYSTGYEITNPFSNAAALAEAEHKRLLGKNTAVPENKVDQAIVAQQVLSLPSGGKALASTGETILGKFADTAGSVLKRKPSEVVAAKATAMTDDAVIPIKTVAEETASTGTKQATSREAELESKVAKRQAENRKIITAERTARKEAMQKIDELIANGSDEAIAEASKLADKYKIDLGPML